ncbi:MAG: N-acetylmuramoyl-L-alanine amidase [Roseburia sp.]|nr:N-acetylmuramoyl-L-alanine amidase [Roseburia sp.]
MKTKRTGWTAEKLNIYITLLSWLILGSLAADVMWRTAMHKTIIIEETESRPDGMMDTAATEGQPLLLRKEQREHNRLCIPLEKGITPENVMLENHYLDKELWVILQGAESAYYQEHEIYGDIDSVSEGRLRDQEKAVALVLKTDRVYEYRSVMENELLTITYAAPGEMYRQVIVVEPMGDTEAQQEITGRVAGLMQDGLEQQNTKLYVAESAGREKDSQTGLMLVQQTGADLYIGLCISSDEDTERYGIQSYYNDEYFIPGFGNVELADTLTRNVTIAARNRAVGLIPLSEDEALGQLSIPAAKLSLGFASNAVENKLLQQEEYQEKLAQGIVEAIKEVYTVRYEE